MKKEKELKHKQINKKEKVKLNRQNYIIIIVPIILIIFLIIAIGLYVFVFSNPSSKLKKYLLDNSYTCNKNSCSIIKDNENHTINYKTGDISISSEDYDCYISNNVTYQAKEDNQICTYYKDNYQRLNPIDNSFTTDASCEKNIETINKHIIYYRELLTNIDIDVNKLY